MSSPPSREAKRLVKATSIAIRLERARSLTRRLLGDKYDSVMTPWRDALAAGMRNHDESVVAALVRALSHGEIMGNEQRMVVLMAAAADLLEETA